MWGKCGEVKGKFCVGGSEETGDCWSLFSSGLDICGWNLNLSSWTDFPCLGVAASGLEKTVRPGAGGDEAGCLIVSGMSGTEILFDPPKNVFCK